MKLQKGQLLDSGFLIIDIVELTEMSSHETQATGIWAKHTQCGVEVFHILNDDSENLFAFAFATTPEDNTGVTHILEHSVLCGSERYPLKDAFLVLAQGSLQTFLNAWTFPDKTVYPASSVNEHDYFNLMSVYGDAVFRPLLSEWTFMQEGHRYEFAKDGVHQGKLSITGVVYNEMKGAYSSLDTYANHWSVKAILPDTPYHFESGGDPEHIPQLSWEGLKDFHRRRYSPANCRIFLAGNIPTEKQLAFLNEQFFASLDGGTAATAVTKQNRWTAPQKYRIPCPAGGDTKPTVFLSWLCSDAANTVENLALAALTEILLGHDGSPLLRALLESGLGEDITPSSGFESELGESLFVAGLRGLHDTAEEAGKKLETLILNELQRLVTEGIPKGEIEAALLFMEFSQREIKRSGGPFSLVWMRRALRAWLHGGKPWDSLLLTPAMETIKQQLAANSRYFESLIQKYLLDNPHRALVIIEPQEDFLPRKEAQFAEALTKTEQQLSAAEKEAIIGKSAALEKMQDESDSPETLAAIPHLSRSDLSSEPALVPRHFENLSSIPALCHDLHTNGISYIDLAFPLDILPPEDYSWLPFFARAAIAVGLPGMDYGEVSSLLARTVGGFNAEPICAPAMDDNPIIQTPLGALNLAGRDWLLYRLKCLDEKAAPSLDIALRLICEADFSDLRRIRDLVLELKNETRSSLAPYGHSYASCRANRFASRSTQIKETWSGITQLAFTHRLAELDTAEVAAKLQSLREAIASGGLIANLAGSADALKANTRLLAERFGKFGPPLAKDLTHRHKDTKGGAPEVFASPLLQIGFAAMTLQAAAFDTPAQLAETVLAHQLSTGALWETIRMKGGAYGAHASSDSIERCFSLSTYRDPNPLRSLDTFAAVFKTNVADFTDEDDLEKTIIGCYARETRPQTPSQKSITDCLRFLSRIDDDYRRRKLERLIAVSIGDIASTLEGLAQQNPFGKVVITGMNDAEQAAKALGVEVQVLPV
ncbi:MAG: insulinase family protein [Treponema sp.]|nr:insulinase family protein [Treponema sp.]